jgi:hypothetical protein
MCTALLGLAFATTASAQSPVERSFFELTEPLEVGKTTLQPGSYQIKVVPTRSSRNILQVWSADETKLFATLLSIPHTEGPSTEQVPNSRYIYYPADANHNKALRTWFASTTPSSGGHDIVYTKQRAMELAALVEAPVVAIPDEVEEAEYQTAPLLLVTPEKEVEPYQIAEAEEEALEPEPALDEQVMVAENRPTQELLPQTASNVPLHAGLGLLLLLGALGLGLIARQRA